MKASQNNTDAGFGRIGPDSSIYWINMILCVSLNTLVLVIIRRQKEIQDVMRFLHRILSAANLSLGILWNVWSAVWFAFKDPYLCSLMSIILMFPSRFALNTIMACLCSININLYLLISRPMHYHIIVTPKRLRLALILKLFIIFLISGYTFPVKRSPFVQLKIEQCLSNEYIFERNAIESFNTFFSLGPILFTFLLLAFIYIKLLLIAKRQLQRVEDMHFPPRRVSDRDVHAGKRDHGPPGRFKGLSTVSLLTGSFLAAWTPVVMVYVIPEASTKPWANILDALGAAYCWVQPTVYLLTNEEAKRLILSAFRNRPRLLQN